MARLIPSFAIASLLLVTGCPGGGTETISVDDFPEQYEEYYCNFAVECGYAPSEEECHDAIVFEGDEWWATLLADVEAGIVEFDGESAAACFNQAIVCDEEYDEDAVDPCDSVFEGTLADGEACFIDMECSGDGWCNIVDDEETCSVGTCYVPEVMDVDEQCYFYDPDTGEEAWNDCVEDAYCSYNDDWTEGTCMAYLAEGESCYDFDTGAYGYCDEGLYCEYGETEALCAPTLALGDVCYDSENYTYGTCDADLYCEYTEDFSSGTCADLPVEGQACQGYCGGDDVTCYYEDGEETGVCTAMPSEGETCDNYYLWCADYGNWCDTSDNTCKDYLAVDEACEEDEYSCVWYATCLDGVCTQYAGLGDSCAEVSCAGNLECGDDEICAAPETAVACASES